MEQTTLERQPEVKVEVLRCDVSDEVALNEMLSEVRRAGPIEGIVHSAGVLRDALILLQTLKYLCV